MVLDVRAEIISNLGPVISGSVRDDHIQGQGLIFTSGELTIAGLITPARGAVVNLAYITPDGGTAARFPRGPFRVVQSFANPLSNESQISIANELAFHKNQGGGSINSDVTAGVNGRDPSIIATTNLRETAGMICGRLSIEVGNLGTWDLPKQQMAIQCDDYIETLSEILASAGRVGYMSAENKLEVIEYASLGNGGPTLTFENIVDVNPNAGGLDFSERPLGEGEAQTLEEEDDDDDDDDDLARYLITNSGYGKFKETWTQTRSDNWSELSLLLTNGSNITYKTQETTKTEELQKEPDNRTISRKQSIINPLVKINSQYIQDHLNAGTSADSISAANTLIGSTVTDTYEYKETRGSWGRFSWTKEEKEQFDQEIETARQNFSGNRLDIKLLPELPTYRLESVTSERKMSEVEALGRIGFKDYSVLPSLPNGYGIESREVTRYIYNGGKIKEIRNTYIAHGLTQIGQQSLAAAAETIDPAVSNYFDIFLKAFWGLVLDNHSVQIYDDPSISEEDVVPGYMSHAKNADIVYRGTSQIQVGEPDTPSSASNAVTAFDPAFLPDDVMNDDGTITTAAEESGESAYDALVRYAEEQNLLLLGHRLGMQIVTSLGRLPIDPLAAFHVQNDGITAMYRTNGMSWAFDSDSCLVSTDALYWGLVGGSVNGPRWTPVAPGITALPTPPAVVNNGAQAPANSITLTSTVNVSNQAAVNTLINSLPNTQTQTFPTQLTPTNISKPFNVIKEVSLSVGPRITVKTVPGGINRDMGSVVIATKPKISVIEKTEAQVIKAKVNVTGPTWSQFTIDLDLDVTATTSAVTSPTNWTITTGDTDDDYPLHGHHSFYADQAAIEADGFTFIGADEDDEALEFTPSAAFQGIEFLDGKVPNSPSHAWRLNTNGGVYYDSDSTKEIKAYNKDKITDIGSADLYVGWWPGDTYVRLAGFLEFNDGTRDWLVVRADMAVPYDSTNDGFSVEAWFATDGSISVRYSAAERYDDPNVSPASMAAGGYSPHATYDANCIVTNGQEVDNMGNYSDRYVGLTIHGNYAVNFLMN